MFGQYFACFSPVLELVGHHYFAVHAEVLHLCLMTPTCFLLFYSSFFVEFIFAVIFKTQCHFKIICKYIRVMQAFRTDEFLVDDNLITSIYKSCIKGYSEQFTG